MRVTTVLMSLSPFIMAQSHTPDCHFTPSPNATEDNYPGATYQGPLPPYNLNTLSEVPVASTCTSADSADELACARKYIDAIDEQLAYLYARRLGFAALAGNAKYRAGDPLNDPGRNEQVAEGMARRVVSYGGSEEAGIIMGGEGCQIYASLGYEVESIRESCSPDFDEDFPRRCE